jgi:hypothetical protein
MGFNPSKNIFTPPATPSTLGTSMSDNGNPFSMGNASPASAQSTSSPFHRPGLFGNTTSSTKSAETSSDALVLKAKAEADRQNMDMKIEYVRPKGEYHDGQYVTVAITPFNPIRGEAHWCFRPTTFEEVFKLARENGNTGIPSILLDSWATSMPQRSASDRKVQKERSVKGYNGSLITIKENVLLVFLDPTLSNDAIEEAVDHIIDALCAPEVKSLYSTFLEKSSKKVRDEVHPDNGPFWRMLECAKSHKHLVELQQIDDITTTGAAMHLVQNMYGITASSWADWPAQARMLASIYGP